MVKQIEVDVLVIGAGATGTAIARELSRYKLETVVVERGADAGIQGQTKASSGMIYTGLTMLTSFVVKAIVAPESPIYDPNNQKIKWLEQGFDLAPQWIEELDLKNRKATTLVIATNKEEFKDLESLLKYGESIGNRYANFRWADRKMCLDMEPHLTKEVVAGLYSSEADIIQISPWGLAMAQAENAKQNGVSFLWNTEVTSVQQKNGYQLVETTHGLIKTRFIVNAAGILADVVADMGGARDWDLTFVRTLMVILDKHAGRLANNNLVLPPRLGKGPICCTTLDDNLILNTAAYELAPRDRYDMGAHPGECMWNLLLAKRYVPEISEKDVIRSYVGMRTFNTRDREENIIEPCSTNPKFINAVVRLPGLISALPIARYVVKLLGDAGLELTTKPDFNPFRKAMPRFCDLSESERNRLIAQNPRYGHVICRCEMVTEGEIVEAIKQGARTVAGVKYRTRAGMGRCQGGFCGPRVVSIIARELNIPVTEVTDLGTGSPVVPYRSKELLQKAAARGGK